MDAAQLGYEQVVMQFYADTIVVALPLTILAIKVIVRFFTREPAKDIFRSLLVLPLDLIYVAFGILLAGMAGRIPAFTSHYGSPKTAIEAGFVLRGTLFFAACFVTWTDRAVRVLWQKFYAAWVIAKQITGSNVTQMTLPGQPVIRKVTVVYLWMFVYWALMIPLTFLQTVVAVASLSIILKRV